MDMDTPQLYTDQDRALLAHLVNRFLNGVIATKGIYCVLALVYARSAMSLSHLAAKGVSSGSCDCRIQMGSALTTKCHRTAR